MPAGSADISPAPVRERKPLRTALTNASPRDGQFDTILYLVRQTTGAEFVDIHIDGMAPKPVPEGMVCQQVPLVHQGERFGVMRAYAQEFQPGAGQLLAGFAALVAEHHALWSVAQSDMLTGALTRRAFLNELGVAVATWSRNGQPCSLISFDLDHFKSINDTYGHAAGDAVLRAVAHLVRSELRPSDRLGRMGGEEFSVLVAADAEMALEIAERLRAVIESTMLREMPHIGFTGSFGVATCGQDAQTRDALIDLADARVYDAKTAGRNRVVGSAACTDAFSLS